jgi:hypothetical protein
MKTLLLGMVISVLGLAEAPVASFTATTANVGGAPDSIRIDVLRWSTDAEREHLMSAWKMTGPAAAPGRGGRAGRGGAGGRGGRGGRGADPAPDPAADPVDDPFARFAERNRAEDAPPPPTPESTLATALKQAGSVGYLWSSEIAGYALRYAGKVAGPDGSERIILITDRRLGKTNDLWTPAGSATASNYEFSVIELRVNAKGEGEGRISLTGKVAPDSAAKIVTPEDYNALPVVLKNVKRKAGL